MSKPVDGAAARPPMAAGPPAPARRASLPPVFPQAWAAAHGEDRTGLWQAFDVAGVRQRLRWVPPGQFVMGSPPTEDGREADELAHQVTLSQGFWLADTACSQALWQAVLGECRSHFQGDLQCPVEQVSWDDICQRFLPALKQRVPGLAAALPTEAQWEYACREAGAAEGPFNLGDRISTDSVNFDGSLPFGDTAPGECRRRTVPVSNLASNALGLYQMHGNVLEWVHDAYAPYNHDAIDPAGPARVPATGQRVLRGGAWSFAGRSCRSAVRFGLLPSRRSPSIGFRLACAPRPQGA